MIDVNELRMAVTVLSFFAFIGIWVWSWSARNKAGFSEAADLPFRDSPAADIEGKQP